jgi:hypothetical protein
MKGGSGRVGEVTKEEPGKEDHWSDSCSDERERESSDDDDPNIKKIKESIEKRRKERGDNRAKQESWGKKARAREEGSSQSELNLQENIKVEGVTSKGRSELRKIEETKLEENLDGASVRPKAEEPEGKRPKNVKELVMKMMRRRKGCKVMLRKLRPRQIYKLCGKDPWVKDFLRANKSSIKQSGKDMKVNKEHKMSKNRHEDGDKSRKVANFEDYNSDIDSMKHVKNDKRAKHGQDTVRGEPSNSSSPADEDELGRRLDAVVAFKIPRVQQKVKKTPEAMVAAYSSGAADPESCWLDDPEEEQFRRIYSGLTNIEREVQPARAGQQAASRQEREDIDSEGWGSWRAGGDQDLRGLAQQAFGNPFLSEPATNLTVHGFKRPRKEGRKKSGSFRILGGRLEPLEEAEDEQPPRKKVALENFSKVMRTVFFGKYKKALGKKASSQETREFEAYLRHYKTGHAETANFLAYYDKVGRRLGYFH